MNRIIICFLLCFSVFCLDFVAADDNCDETCEQVKFDKVKSATSGLRETCDEMKSKIDSLEAMLETLEDERKWTLAFKVEAGSHICAHCAWSKPVAVNPQSYLEAIDLKKPCGCAFVNHDVLANWTLHFQSKMTQVSLSFWNRTDADLVRVASVLFDGRGSDAASWFKRSRISDSSFEDLHKKGVLQGDDDHELLQLSGGERTSFSIQGAHTKACDGSDYFIQNATGWMMVAQKAPLCLASDPAAAAAAAAAADSRFPQLIYTEDRTAGSWGGDSVRYADVMTIFVR